MQKHFAFVVFALAQVVHVLSEQVYVGNGLGGGFYLNQERGPVLFMQPNKYIRTTGSISRFHVVIRTAARDEDSRPYADQIHFVLLRPDDDPRSGHMTFLIRRVHVANTTTSGNKTYDIPVRERVAVLPGDRVGFFVARGGVPVDGVWTGAEEIESDAGNFTLVKSLDSPSMLNPGRVDFGEEVRRGPYVLLYGVTVESTGTDDKRMTATTDSKKPSGNAAGNADKVKPAPPPRTMANKAKGDTGGESDRDTGGAGDRDVSDRGVGSDRHGRRPGAPGLPGQKGTKGQKGEPGGFDAYVPVYKGQYKGKHPENLTALEQRWYNRGNCSVHHRAHCDQICWQWGPDEHEEDEDPETGEELEPDHTCACFDGFVLNEEDHSTCLDIDECAYKNAGCQGICENIPGSYHCNCSAGFDLAIDEHSCIARPQCGTSLDTCYQLRDSHPGVRCMDTVGSHICIEPGSRIVIPLNDTGCRRCVMRMGSREMMIMFIVWLIVLTLVAVGLIAVGGRRINTQNKESKK